MRAKTALTFCVLLALSGCPRPFQAVSFDDPALETAIRDAIDQPTGSISKADLLSLTRLDAEGAGIASLEGLQHCVRLRDLNLQRNAIADVSPLARLCHLRSLALSNNQIVDASPLASLTGLRELRVAHNDIETLGDVGRLRRLEFLYADDNALTEVSELASLSRLTFLGLADNALTDLTPLAGLDRLRTLRIDGNPSGDAVALVTTAYPTLDTLGVSDSQVVSLDALLDLAPRLRHLVLRGPGFTDLAALPAFNELRVLRLEDSTVTDFTPLAALPHLSAVGLARNGIDDLADISALTQLTYIDLSGNEITDLGPLPVFTALAGIDLSGNPITDIRRLAPAQTGYGYELDPSFFSLLLLFDWDPSALSLPLPIINVLDDPLDTSTACPVLAELDGLQGTVLTGITCGKRAPATHNPFR